MPTDQYKIIYTGQRQRPRSNLGDGYSFTVSVRGEQPVDTVLMDTYNGAKQNCYEISHFQI